MPVKAKQIYQSVTAPMYFVKLESLNGALWDYLSYNGPLDGLFDGKSWSRGQIDDHKPGLSEWMLLNHYTLFDESGGIGVYFSVKNKNVYGATHRENQKDFQIPMEILKNLFIEEKFEQNVGDITDDDLPIFRWEPEETFDRDEEFEEELEEENTENDLTHLFDRRD